MAREAVEGGGVVGAQGQGQGDGEAEKVGSGGKGEPGWNRTGNPGGGGALPAK